MNNIVTGLALLVLFFVVNCESLTSFKQDGCKVHKSYKSQSYRLNEKCFIRSQSGRCMANISSYHFSPKQNKCVQSTFGGCNDGCFAFKTMQECESSCLRMSIQPIKEEPQSMKPFGQKKCSVSKPKIMTGFLSKLDNKCFIKTQPGMCRGATPSYHFDTTQNKCVEANFGGCDDGCLAFKSIQECESSCLRMSIQPIKEEPQSMKPFGQKKCSVSKPKIMIESLNKLDDKCFIKTQSGMCRGATPSYHFDTTQNKCVEANFGGCDDGCLAFKSIQECESTCQTYHIMN